MKWMHNHPAAPSGYGPSVIHRLDARWKFAWALTLVVIVVTLPLDWQAAYVLLSAAVLGVFAITGISWSYLAKRLLLTLPALLLIAAGVVASLGVEAGLKPAAGILVRSLLSLTIFVIMAATTPFEKALAALKHFRVPSLLVLVAAFMYRYMFVLADELAQMRRARRARSFCYSYWSELNLLGSFAGVLFVRAFERADRVYAAMCARGGSGKMT